MRWAWPADRSTTHELTTTANTYTRVLSFWEELVVAWSWQASLVVFFTAAAFLVYAFALVGQHRAFNSHGWDLAWFDQVIWNTANGRPFQNSFAPWNFLGEHVEPILLLYAFVYRIESNVEILLVSQALVGTLGAVPLYLGARKTIGSSMAALLLVVAFLSAPHFSRAMLFDFHPEVMAVTCVFAAFAFLAHDRPNLALAVTASAFLFKEDASLIGLGLAWLFWLFRYRRHAIAVAGTSAVYFVVITGFLMPHFRGSAGGPHARWEYLGESGPEIVVGAVTNPLSVLEHLVRDASLTALGELLLGQAGLLLASPASLAALPLAGAHLLSVHESESGLQLHYGVLPFALSFVGTTLAIGRLSRIRWISQAALPHTPAVVLAGTVLLSQLVFMVIAGPFGLRFDPSHYRATDRAGVIREAIGLVPHDASVAAQSGLLPHLSQRQRVWEFPVAFGAEYVVVDRKAWWESHGPWSPEMDYDFALAALPQTGYCLRFDEDGVQVWQRIRSCSLSNSPRADSDLGWSGEAPQ